MPTTSNTSTGNSSSSSFTPINLADFMQKDNASYKMQQKPQELVYANPSKYKKVVCDSKIPHQNYPVRHNSLENIFPQIYPGKTLKPQPTFRPTRYQSQRDFLSAPYSKRNPAFSYKHNKYVA